MYAKILLSIVLFFVASTAFATNVVPSQYAKVISYLGTGENFFIYSNSLPVEIRTSYYTGYDNWNYSEYTGLYSYLVGIGKATAGVSFQYNLNPDLGVYQPIFNGNYLFPEFSTGSTTTYTYGTSYEYPLKIRGDKYLFNNTLFCLYIRSDVVTPVGLFVPGISGVSCQSFSYNSKNFVPISINFGTTPPAEPTETPPTTDTYSYTIGGLQCTTKKIANINSTVWTNLGELPYFSNLSSTGVLFHRYADVSSGSITDADQIRLTLVNDNGSQLEQDSISWTGATTNSFIIGDGEVQVRATRDKAPLGFNVVQFGNVALPFGNTIPTRYQYLNGNYHNGLSILSGSTLTISTPELSKFVGVSQIGRFKGIRVGVAPEENVTFCGVSGARCGWKTVGTSSTCISLLSSLPLEQGGCGITGSGSIYGSGACVPLATASGAIIPHVKSTESTLYYDENGNITYTNSNRIDTETEVGSIFECGINYIDDSWYAIIGKALICPVTIAKNFFDTSYKNASEAYNGLASFSDTVEELSNTTASISTGATLNPVLTALRGDMEAVRTSDNIASRILNFVYWSFILCVALVLIGIIIFNLKKR